MTPILIFDDKCTLCNRFKMATEHLVGEKVIYRSVHEDALYEEFPYLNKDECETDIHLLIAPKQILVGAEALAWLVERFPGVQKFAWLAKSKAGKKSIEFFHTMTTKYRRSLLNRCPGCKTAKSTTHRSGCKKKHPEL